MPKVSIEANFDDVIRSITKATGDAREAVEEALKATFNIVTPRAQDAVAKPNLPAGGEFSSGDSEGSLKRTPKITWVKDTGYVDVGFSVRAGGIPTLFMLYGKPRYMKSTMMYNAFYGEETKAAVRKAQGDILNKYLDKALGV